MKKTSIRVWITRYFIVVMIVATVLSALYGVKYHHERYDGTGYPNGLSGTDIPEIARIIAVADAYDAMASDRSYRKMLPQEVVRDEILRGKGKQFDPAIADVMVQIIDEDRSYTHR
ncbi:MAG: HD domain-containing protein [Lachnospiraceae bacterium]|nr:HD domain-containing protein [Lachnospiraceae bacterium]